jgi:hypothetical protein
MVRTYQINRTLFLPNERTSVCRLCLNEERLEDLPTDLYKAIRQYGRSPLDVMRQQIHEMIEAERQTGVTVPVVWELSSYGPSGTRTSHGMRHHVAIVLPHGTDVEAFDSGYTPLQTLAEEIAEHATPRVMTAYRVHGHADGSPMLGAAVEAGVRPAGGSTDMQSPDSLPTPHRRDVARKIAAALTERYGEHPDFAKLTAAADANSPILGRRVEHALAAMPRGEQIPPDLWALIRDYWRAEPETAATPE